MKTTLQMPPVVVGVDGSRAAVSATVWAVDEAVQRDVPLRLTYVIDGDDDADSAAHDLATAEIAVRECIVAAEAGQKPVKIEVEIRWGNPTSVLLEASKSAAMMCIGATGQEHMPGATLGAHIGELTGTSHCPIAVIPATSPFDTSGVLAEIDDPWDTTAVLEHGVAEARLRHANLYIHDTQVRAAGSRCAHAELEHKLDWLRRKYPDLNMKMTASPGSTTTYLRKHAASVDLLVAGRTRRGGLGDLIGSPRHTAAPDARWPVLVCPPRAAL